LKINSVRRNYSKEIATRPLTALPRKATLSATALSGEFGGRFSGADKSNSVTGLYVDFIKNSWIVITSAYVEVQPSNPARKAREDHAPAF